MDVGKDQEFTVKSKGAGGQGKVLSKIVGPSGAAVPCKVEPGLGADNSVVRFVPREEGSYEVEVTYDGVPVPGSPFSLEAVPPTKPSKVRGGARGTAHVCFGLTLIPSPLGPSEQGPTRACAHLVGKGSWNGKRDRWSQAGV